MTRYTYSSNEWSRFRHRFPRVRYGVSAPGLFFIVVVRQQVRPEHLRKALEGRVAGRLRTRRFTFSIGQEPSGAT